MLLAISLVLSAPLLALAQDRVRNSVPTSVEQPLYYPPYSPPPQPFFPSPPTPSTPPQTGVGLTAITPPEASPGTVVRLSGFGFGSNNTIHITSPAGASSIGAAALSDQFLSFVIPPLANGVYEVTVTSYRGTSNALPLTITGSSSPVPPPASPPPQPGPQPALQYGALGDSIARGFFGLFSYVNHFRTAIERDLGIPVQLSNLSQSGWTSAQLLFALRTDLDFRTTVSRTDILTWNIGGNDLRSARDRYRRQTCGGQDNQDCLRQMASSFKQNWDGIMTEIITIRPPQQYVVRTMDIYYPYVTKDSQRDTWPNDAGSDFVVLAVYVRDINGHIGASTSSRGIPLAPVYRTYNGPSGNEDPNNKGYITFDGFHPSTRGQQVIADLLRGLGYSPRR